VAPAIPGATWPAPVAPVDQGAAQPVAAYGGSGPQLNGLASPPFGAGPQQLFPGVAAGGGAASGDLSQRMLMDYMAMVQSQVGDAEAALGPMPSS
jgi:hypothetical protein